MSPDLKLLYIMILRQSWKVGSQYISRDGIVVITFSHPAYHNGECSRVRLEPVRRAE